MNLHDHYIFEDGSSISAERLIQQLRMIDERAIVVDFAEDVIKFLNANAIRLLPQEQEQEKIRTVARGDRSFQDG